MMMADAGLPPDPWQAEVLDSASKRLMLLCSRGAGKSQVVAALALHTALFTPRSLTLILCPTNRQSGEVFRERMLTIYEALGEPVPWVQRSQLTIKLANGSRIVALPENEEGIRVYNGVDLLIIDEAARVSTELYRAVRPMLSLKDGRLVALSTAFGKTGWYYEAWTKSKEWRKWKVPADRCPRITAEWLENERREWPENEFLREFFCVFQDAAGSAFRPEDVAAMFGEARPAGRTALYTGW